MKDTASAATLGAVIEYLMQRHWAELEWIVHLMMG